jgi:hypothetical protein
MSELRNSWKRRSKSPPSLADRSASRSAVSVFNVAHDIDRASENMVRGEPLQEISAARGGGLGCRERL